MPTWSTASEESYIRRIKDRTTNSGNLTRLQILEGYLISIRKRVNWVSIDKYEVEQLVRREIAKEKANGV